MRYLKFFLKWNYTPVQKNLCTPVKESKDLLLS